MEAEITRLTARIILNTTHKEVARDQIIAHSKAEDIIEATGGHI